MNRNLHMNRHGTRGSVPTFKDESTKQVAEIVSDHLKCIHIIPFRLHSYIENWLDRQGSNFEDHMGSIVRSYGYGKKAEVEADPEIRASKRQKRTPGKLL
mmetsp:Transcript_13029/g.23885  ORF Transcript_13029/g.23885 Transcript_13029/m.23885 type:complete len:100 (-) Transcript_13029:221-520(-)